MLSKYYAQTFPESFEPSLDDAVTYIGPFRMTDIVPEAPGALTAGQLLLSPTRTYAPVLRQLLSEHFEDVHGLIHCSGGGQTKCLKYLPGPMRIIKDNLFETPPVFRLIQQASGADDREMYQVFNMGCRMEIYTSEAAAASILKIARHWGVEAQVIGRVETSSQKEVVIGSGDAPLVYTA
jgi:phosphoribosylformylglycinamidine cyclo-ligase